MQWLRRALVYPLCVPACVAAAAVVVSIASDASASVSIAIGFEDLVKDADVIAVVSPSDAGQSLWEDGRIYTYTKVKVEQGVAGNLGAGADGWVRTMGGVVGKIGQMVEGEPVFTQGKSSLLFLHKFKGDTVFEVSARAQGQYPVMVDAATKSKKLIRAMNAGVLLQPKDHSSAPVNQSSVPSSTISVPDNQKVHFRLAMEVMHERALEEASREIATTWSRLHPPAPAPPPATNTNTK